MRCIEEDRKEKDIIKIKGEYHTNIEVLWQIYNKQFLNTLNKFAYLYHKRTDQIKANIWFTKSNVKTLHEKNISNILRILKSMLLNLVSFLWLTNNKFMKYEELFIIYLSRTSI